MSLTTPFSQKNLIVFAEIHTDSLTGNRSLIAQSGFSPGDIICNFYWNKILEFPNYLTIQIGENQHIELLPTCLECTNHSCDPNCFFDITSQELICLKAINLGDELTFFYPSSEWEMEQIFICQCGTKHCIQIIKGAKYINPTQRQRYRFTDFINKNFTLDGQ